MNALPPQFVINIYPNPTTSSWRFELKDAHEKNLQLIITDVTGRVVSKQSFNGDIISASAPTRGSYVYYIADANGNALHSGKLQRL